MKNNKLIEFLEENYPSLVNETEDGNLEVNFNKLKEELNDVNISEETYGLNWMGKSYARVLRDYPVTTLIEPDNKHNNLEENKDSNNVYIEGDNLEVLKHLKNAYSNKIKMIYIDPPYNTGSDGFVYNDSFNFKVEDFMQLANVDEDEAKKILDYTTSKRSSHSAWLTFMYPRLYIARELLKDDGVIFISIDDNEQAQLKLLCDEIFGEDNFIETFKYTKTLTPPSASNKTRNMIEYVLCYQKNKDDKKFVAGQKDGGDAPLYNESNSYRTLKFPKDTVITNLEDGVYKRGKRDKITLENDVIVENGVIKNDFELSSNFRWLQSSLDEEIRRGTKLIVKTNTFSIRYKLEDKRNYLPSDLLNDIGTNESGRKDVEQLFEKRGIFSFPKPVSLLSYLTKIINEKNAIILDFFSGSGTTAQAVMELNATDSGNRKYIMVQLPEEIDKKSSKEAYDFCKKELKSKNPMIPDIAKERIKRAAKKIKEENKDKEYINDIDFGFKVYKTIEDKRTKLSDIKEFDVNQKLLFDTDNLEALLTTWMLYDGYDLNTKVENFSINKYNGYLVESTLYLMDKDFSTKDLKTLVEKLSDEQTPIINRIVINEANFTNKMLAEINEQVFDKNIKEVNINIIKRV